MVNNILASRIIYLYSAELYIKSSYLICLHLCYLQKNLLAISKHLFNYYGNSVRYDGNFGILPSQYIISLCTASTYRLCGIICKSRTISPAHPIYKQPLLLKCAQYLRLPLIRIVFLSSSQNLSISLLIFFFLECSEEFFSSMAII